MVQLKTAGLWNPDRDVATKYVCLITQGTLDGPLARFLKIFDEQKLNDSDKW